MLKDQIHGEDSISNYLKHFHTHTDKKCECVYVG